MPSVWVFKLTGIELIYVFWGRITCNTAVNTQLRDASCWFNILKAWMKINLGFFDTGKSLHILAGNDFLGVPGLLELEIKRVLQYKINHGFLVLYIFHYIWYSMTIRGSPIDVNGILKMEYSFQHGGTSSGWGSTNNRVSDVDKHLNWQNTVLQQTSGIQLVSFIRF